MKLILLASIVSDPPSEPHNLSSVQRIEIFVIKSIEMLLKYDIKCNYAWFLYSPLEIRKIQYTMNKKLERYNHNESKLLENEK